MSFQDLKSAVAETVQVAGTIFLVIALAALPFVVFGVGLNATALGLLALIGLPIFGGAALVLVLLCLVDLACLPIRIMLKHAVARRVERLPGGVWDVEIDGTRKTKPAGPAHLRIARFEGGLLVRFRDWSVIYQNYEAIAEVGGELYDLAGHERIVLDFEGVDLRLPAAFEAKLIILHKRAASAGNTLILSGLHPTTISQFEINGLILFLNIVPDWQDVST